MLANDDHVTVFEWMFPDAVPVDLGVIGSVQIFQGGIIKNSEQLCVMPARDEILDTDVIVILAYDSHDFLVESKLVYLF